MQNMTVGFPNRARVTRYAAAFEFFFGNATILRFIMQLSHAREDFLCHQTDFIRTGHYL